MKMEWSWSFLNQFHLLVGLIFFFQTKEFHINAKGIALYTMPGEACSYIIEQREQYQVISAENGANDTYQSNVDCSITFRGRQDEAFIIRITEFALEYSDFCEKDALYIYDGVNDEAKLMTKHGYGLCGETLSLPNYFSTSGGSVTIKFVTDIEKESTGFSLYVTPFTKEGNDTCPGFICVQSQKCISGEAKCNGAYQCEDASDEPDNCPRLAGSFLDSSPGQVFLLVVVALALTRLR